MQLPVQVMTGAEGQQAQGFSCKCIYSVKVLLALYLERNLHLVCFMSVGKFLTVVLYVELDFYIF